MTDPGSRAPSDDFARIEAAFADATPLDADARDALLGAAFADRPDLRNDVEALLTAHDRLPADEGFTAAAPGPGSRVGAYTLVEKLGEGGMGEVYRAERAEGGFDQQVAVKITRASLDRDDVRRRFRIERQILASLHHPNIVTMLDGGATADGQAYFVMEYVPGQTIAQYARDKALPLDQRLMLMRTICGAVQYAHQRAIVHRDLKPANILVQSDGVPKVLDFGLAKLLNTPHDAGATLTGLLPAPMTPNYASPEQLRGLPVTTACDVYALGVLLYEIVAGVRPYETHGQPLDRLVQIVLHDEPPRPSAAASRTLPYSRALLRGDVDAIVSKAMHKEPGERYDSAGELARDLTRALDHEPVLARPASTAYVLRRMAARHKAAVSIAGLALVAVLAASAAAIWQQQVARREQARAETLFRDVRQLANSLIFKVHDAVVPLPGSTDVRRTIVNDAVAYLERLEAQSGGDPELRLELAGAYRQIAGILGDPQKPNLGDRDGALRQYERSKAVAATLLSADAPFEAVEAYARAGQQLSTLHALRGDRATAVAAARDVVERATEYERRHPADARGPKLVAASNFYLAWALPVEESIAVWERALAYYEAQLRQAPDSTEWQRNAALMSKYLAPALKMLGRRDESETHYRRALALDETRLRAAPHDRQTRLDLAISYGNMGEFFQNGGNLAEAAAFYARSVDLRRRVVEADPKDVQARERLAYGLTMVGQLRGQLGETAAARAFLSEAIDVQERVLAVTGDMSGRRQLANAWFEVGALEERVRERGTACAAYGRSHAQFKAAEATLVDYDRQRMQVAVTKAAACR